VAVPEYQQALHLSPIGGLAGINMGQTHVLQKVPDKK